MRFDYYILNSYVPERDGDGQELHRKWIEQVQLADQLGYEIAWLTEHHFDPFGGMLPNPHLLIAALSQRTQRIRFGTAVTLLALHHPLRVAEDMAVLDILTNGRIEMGVGRGMPHTKFALFGVAPTSAQERLQEAIAILRCAWTEELFTWRGTYLQCPDPISVLPRPVQQPHPRLWLTVSRDPAHARWAGQEGLNLMTLPWNLPSFEMTRNIIDEYRTASARAGRQGQVLAMYPAYVSQTIEGARHEVEQSWARFRDMAASLNARIGIIDRESLPFGRVVDETRAIFGDPATCRQHVMRIEHELGIDRLALLFHFGGLSQERVLASMRLFSAAVAASP